MRAAFSTLGCKVNQYETSVLIQHFSAAGFDIVEPEQDADVYVLNSCTVTAQGDRKSRQLLRRFRRRNPSAVICLCGCFPQAFPDVAEKIPEADIITGSGNRAALLDAVRARLAGGERVVDIPPPSTRFEKMRVSAFPGHTRAFIKIQDGCERFCAYCIIPTARGPVRSKPLHELREELATLAQNGFQEVVLVGINLSSYGRELGFTLLDAVQTACDVPGIRRVRLGSLEPELLSRDDIGALARLPGFCPQFHLSLQSGCDATLRRMRRHYDTAEYRRIVHDLRDAFANPAITTDIMVGFPGETDEEFAQSLAFCEEMGFARMHVFAYSVRPGTAAAHMPHQVDPQTKALRARQMGRLAEQNRRRFLQTQAGTVAQVLFESNTPDGFAEGYTENYTPVRVPVPSGEHLTNQIRRVSLCESTEEGCLGRLTD